MLGPSFGSGLFFCLGSAWAADKTQDGTNPGSAQMKPRPEDAQTQGGAQI